MPTVSNNPATKSRREILAPMLAAKMTEREIAKSLDRCKTTIHQSIHKYFTQSELDAFAKTEVNDLRAFRKTFLSTVDLDAIKKMIASRGMTDYGIAFDKERILTGLNDSNIKPMIQINIGGQVVQINTQPSDKIATIRPLDSRNDGDVITLTDP